MMNALEMFVSNDLKLRYIRIDGQVAAKIRYENVQLFQNDPGVKVAILSLNAASTGLTLTASSNIVFAEMNWTPAIMQQAEDRAHRIGQENSVLCHYIVGEKTLDDMLYKKIEQKIAIVSNILDGEQKRLKMDEIQNADGDIQNFESDLKNKDEELPDDIEVQTGSTYSAKKQTYSQADFLKQIVQQREMQKNLDQEIQPENNMQIDIEPEFSSALETQQEDNGIQNQNIEINKNPIYQSDGGDGESDSSDSEDMFILKMIAQQQAEKLKEQQNSNSIQIESTIGLISDNKLQEMNSLGFQDIQKIPSNSEQQNSLQSSVQVQGVVNQQNKQNTQNSIIQQSKSLNNAFNQQTKNQSTGSVALNKTSSKNFIKSKSQLSQNPSNNLKMNSQNGPSDDQFLFCSEEDDDYNDDDNNIFKGSMNSQQTFSQPFKSNSIDSQKDQSKKKSLYSKNERYSTLSSTNTVNGEQKESKSIRISTGFDFLDDAIDSIDISSGKEEEDNHLFDDHQIKPPQNPNQQVSTIGNTTANKERHFSSSTTLGQQANGNKSHRVSTGLDFLDEALDDDDSDSQSLNNDILVNYSYNKEQTNQNKSPIVNKTSTTVRNITSTQKQIQPKQIISEKNVQENVIKQNTLLSTPPPPLTKGSVGHLQLSKSANQKTPKEQKKKTPISVEVQENGIKKITFDNGDVKYISDSDNEDDDDDDEVDFKELESIKKKYIPNTYNLIKQPQIQNQQLIKSPLTNKFNGNLGQQQTSLQKQMKQPSSQNNNYQSDGGDGDDVSNEFNFQDFCESAKFKSNPKRKRDEFEKSYAQTNGISQNEANNLFNTVTPQKQQQISKKQICKMANQHF